MSVKAFIIEVDEKEKSKDQHLEEKKVTEDLKFVVPGCVVGKACNKCGNCH